MANAQISDGASVSSANPNQFGDYSGMTYFQGLVHPIWGDTSNSGGLNPNGTAEFDAYTDSVTGGMAANEGDPHLTTVNGTHYDFQSAGEFVVLRDADGMQIQTRQSPVSTASVVGPNGHTGLTTCVSLNTAVAARVGTRRVTFQPRTGSPDPSSLELRIDGVLTALGPGGIDLGSGGRVTKSVGDGIQIDFPNGTVLVVTPLFWTSQGRWYLNVSVLKTPAVEGIMGVLARGSWLPALPDGTSMGPRPPGLSQRYADLYQKFADAWRVTDKTSLFDYASGTSTATFTIDKWPVESPPCEVPESPPAKPLPLETAQKFCSDIIDRNRRADCIFDVRVTGEPSFAKLYLLSQQIQRGSTMTIVSGEDQTSPEEVAVFVATVRPLVPSRGPLPAGLVEFTLNGERVGRPIKLDSRGRAILRSTALKEGKHQIVARYLPATGSAFLSSTGEKTHLVGNRK